MGKINILDKNISELIAAGEVIERPASIVKELVENAIDAGSTAITIEIKRGGISYIRITDNGCGFEKEDIPVAFKRHATSKITSTDDLDCIATLGFRGEALASIAAVSKMELTSKTISEQFGSSIYLEAGEEVSFEEAGCPDGTTMIVKDLFYNVPARLKFLKKDISEANVICGIVDKLALSNPHISFKLISDNKVKLHTPGNGDMLSAIHAVFGKDFSGALIPVDYEYNGVQVTGYTSKANASRPNRAMQHFFVNTRYVRSKVCTAAIEEGYKNAIMIGKFPFCVLDVKVPFNSVDVNVHPAKIEVRFTNERSVFDAIYFAIKSSLAKTDHLTNAIQSNKNLANAQLLSKFKNEESEQIKINVEKPKEPIVYQPKMQAQSTAQVFSTKAEYEVQVKKPTHKEVVVQKEDNHTVSNDLSQFQYINPESLKPKAVSKKESDIPIIKLEQPIEEEKEIQQSIIHEEQAAQEYDLPIRMIGELFKTYILFETGENFIMLDKHAAHERILYEKLKKSILTEQKQMLLKPIIVNLSSAEFNALIANEELLNSMGFVFEEFGANTVAVREVPLVLSHYDIQTILLDIAVKLSENKRDVSSGVYENLLHSIACRSAIKANDTNSIEELNELIRMVITNDEIRNCPHGRPIVTMSSKYEIEKQFGRI
ncbi:DNA mismatch repair endonuclease MutL [Paludicola sp. MB14-C6]|uniref:DNA mismatch repair endonuclease MutL n=1 Tax=Paludihabitans sp. MB14-C6 TaxID=3070656 RepID=UPI0027DE2CD5|nr:DNA mismatch repair endonuclease MutL [Paludicola sp. MB14-C6]WMJ23106.1 DNA mismatch repair endonuclease MutL [Paludicola sp. MB14-C6]